MRIGLWITLGILAYKLFQANSRPAWVDDLLIRTYAADHVTPAPETSDPDYPKWQASLSATSVGVPVGWLYELSKLVPTADLQKLTDGAKLVLVKVQALGPPADALPATLAAYKAGVLNQVAVALRG